MTGIDLIDAMAGIDEGYIQEARQYQRSVPVWLKGISIAACFICILLIGIFSIARLVTKPQEVSPVPIAPAETTPVVPEEESSVEESAPEETAEIFSPYRIVGDTILYGNTEWHMSVEEVYAAEKLSEEKWTHDKESRNVFCYSVPIDGHPEITRMVYQFNYRGPSLEYGLIAVHIEYDAKQISFDELVAQRIEELGEPNSVDPMGYWLMADLSNLRIVDNGTTVLEQIYGGTEAFIGTVRYMDVESYLEDIQPPGGHFGWTYQQHIDQGLLVPENGTEEWIENEDGSRSFYFHCTTELGGYTVPIDYYFGPTLATDEYVLKQVFVTPPEEISYQDWIASFSDTFWVRKLYESSDYHYVSPVMLSHLLTEEQQKDYINQLVSLGQATAEEFTFTNWSLVTFFYSEGVWQYNGTGAALYLTTPQS